MVRVSFGILIVLFVMLGIAALTVVLVFHFNGKLRREFEESRQKAPVDYQDAQYGYAPRPDTARDEPSVGYAMLGAFFPVVGLILYLAWCDTLPFRAKSTGRGAIIGSVVYAAFVVLTSVALMSFAFLMVSSS
jgi:hypothetical protein